MKGWDKVFISEKNPNYDSLLRWLFEAEDH